MHRKSFADMNCTIARALDEIGEWWSLLIVRECAQGSHRFDEFTNELGIARNILTQRLARLVDLGILEKFPLTGRANTDGYRLTRKGEDLFPVLVALGQWGDKWLAPAEGPPVKLVDNVSGAAIEPITVRSANGQVLSYRDVRYAEGPGATAAVGVVIANRNKRVLGGAGQ